MRPIDCTFAYGFDLHQEDRLTLSALASTVIPGAGALRQPLFLETALPHLSDDTIKQCEAQLRAQRNTVLATIRQRLHQAGDSGEMALANHFADVREQAEADLLGDTDIGQLQLELADLADIDEALGRIAGGAYGVCAGCGEAIAPARLHAQPAARMCLPCQAALEKQHHPAHR